MITITSILYDQLFSNVMFIKQLAADDDTHIFISTKEMEEKYKAETIAKGKKITDPVYKIPSVTQSLGLQATSFVVIFSRLNKNNRDQTDSLEDIAWLMRIKKYFQSTILKLIDYGS